MNQSEVERAVTRATGESRRFIKRFGFSVIADEREHFADASLVVDCPGCSAVFNLDDVANPRSELECPRCDAVYPIAAGELYVADSPRAAPAACA
jgi:uncharacterized paraquat-inducible protein A